MNSIKLCMFIFTYNISIIKINSHDVKPSDSFSCSGQRHGESQAAWWPAFAEPPNGEAHWAFH